MTIQILDMPLRSRGGSMRVAILGNPALDLTWVDLRSLRFGPNGAAPLSRDGAGSSGVPSHVDGDEHLDLVLRFDAKATGLRGRHREACLEGVIDLGESPFSIVAGHSGTEAWTRPARVPFLSCAPVARSPGSTRSERNREKAAAARALRRP